MQAGNDYKMKALNRKIKLQSARIRVKLTNHKMTLILNRKTQLKVRLLWLNKSQHKQLRNSKLINILIKFKSLEQGLRTKAFGIRKFNQCLIVFGTRIDLSAGFDEDNRKNNYLKIENHLTC